MACLGIDDIRGFESKAWFNNRIKTVYSHLTGYKAFTTAYYLLCLLKDCVKQGLIYIKVL